jgi:RNA polymerase sigma factor (sigma-70 family)
VKSNPQISEDEASLEQTLDNLIQDLRVAKNAKPIDPDRIGKIESEIFTRIDSYLRMSLKPVMAKTFGPGVYRDGSSVQFTLMLNDLFVKILDRYHVEELRMETARDLRNWCSSVIRHQMLDYVRQKQNQDKLLKDIAPMYEAQRNHFRNRFGEHFDDLLHRIEEWSSSDDPDQKLYAKLLELHYVFGMTWDETCDTMNISKSTFYRLRDNAITALNDALNPNSASE